MRYNLQNDLKRKNFLIAVEKAYDKRALVEFSEVKQRSLNQNAYLHLCLSYVAKEMGESLEYVKQVAFKQIWNPDIFRKEMRDSRSARVYVCWRSSADLNAEEMTRAITNMRNCASRDLGIYIPSAEEKGLIEQMMREI